MKTAIWFLMKKGVFCVTRFLMDRSVNYKLQGKTLTAQSSMQDDQSRMSQRLR